MSLFSRPLEQRTIVVEKAKDSKKAFNDLNPTQTDPRSAVFTNPHLQSMIMTRVKQEDTNSGSELLKKKLRALLTELPLKPGAKLDSIIEGLMLLSQARASDTIVHDILHTNFSIPESGSQKIYDLLRAEQSTPVTNSEPDVPAGTSPSPGPTAGPQVPPAGPQVPPVGPQAPPAATQAPPAAQAPPAGTQAPPTGPQAPDPPAIVATKKKLGGENKRFTIYQQTSSTRISVAPDGLGPEAGDILTHRTTTAPSGEQFQAWLCHDDGNWTDITNKFKANAKIHYPPDRTRILVQKWDRVKMTPEVSWLKEDWLESRQWKGWDKPSWAARAGGQ